MTTAQRAMLEQTLYNLRFDMDCIGEEFWYNLQALTDRELETVINDVLMEE